MPLWGHLLGSLQSALQTHAFGSASEHGVCQLGPNHHSLRYKAVAREIREGLHVSHITHAHLLGCRYNTTIPHLMMLRCTTSPLLVRFEAKVSSATCAYLLDHIISGNVILPGAAMIEAATAATKSTLSMGSWAHAASSDNIVLLSASILAPFALPLPTLATDVSLVTEVNIHLCQVTQFSKRSTSKDTHKHFKSNLGSSSIQYGLFDTSVATKMILVQTAAQGSEDAGVALALVQQKQMKCQQAGQFLLHPALLDNNMQAGASLIGTSPSKATKQTRVPIGMQACKICQGPWQTQTWACASIAALLSDGSVRCNFNLVTLPKVKENAQIFEMSFKPAARILDRSPHDPLSTAPGQHCLYETSWEALHVCSHGLENGHFLQGSSIWQGLDAHTRVLWQHSTKGSTLLAAAASGLRLIQTLRGQWNVHLINTVHASPLLGQAPLPKLKSYMHDVAQVGLLRVASQERSTSRWHHILRSPYDSKRLMENALLQQADASGLCTDGQCCNLPMLKTRHPGKSSKYSDVALFSQQHTGATVIIGGLGGIGSVFSTYTVAKQMKWPLLLLSRSGRHKNPIPNDIAQSRGLLCLSRCDAACSEETAISTSNGVPLQFPIKYIVHAGGVVMDKALTNQVCHLSRTWRMALHKSLFVALLTTLLVIMQDISSMRLVMAPKTIVAKEMISRFAPIPVHQWNMFSSLSALLGTPGQANYVVANLQINEVSHQQHGKGRCTKSHEASQ